MPRDASKLLEDVVLALEHLLAQTKGLDFDRYSQDRNLQLVAERSFEIVGEALNRLSRSYPSIAAKIPELSRIVSFRNILAHGYDTIDIEIVWDITARLAPSLLEDVRACMEDA